MEIKALTCPQCGGPIDYKPGMALSFCPYCGTKIYFDDGTQRIEKRIEIIDRTKIREEEEKTKRHKQSEEGRTERSKDAGETLLLIALIMALIIGMLALHSSTNSDGSFLRAAANEFIDSLRAIFQLKL